MLLRGSKSQVVYSEDSSSSSAGKDIACIFSHFSLDNKISDRVVYYVNSLSRAGCDVIFVSACGGSMLPEELGKLEGIAVTSIVRQNVGYDFGSWKDGLEHSQVLKAGYRAILFANDSVYGPFVDLSNTLEGWLAGELELMGLTESFERGYHLQSYFWGVTGRALRDGFIDYFFGSYYRHFSNRAQVIRQYELAFARIGAERYGLKVGALYPVHQLAEGLQLIDLKKFNPVHHGAMALLSEMGFPFAKRELLDRNPLQVNVAAEVREYINLEFPDYSRDFM